MLLPALALSGCGSEDAQPKPTGLVGYWSLNRLECYCPPNAPTPNEAIAFDAAGNVTEYENGQIKHSGTYQLSQGTTSCADNADLVTFSWSSSFTKSSYTIVNDQLVLDYGLCFDAPRKTYTFVPAGKTK
ncbi:hypothetical protein GCM10027048_27320 [Hymenobacter coalescens]